MLKEELLLSLPSYIARQEFKSALGITGDFKLSFLAQGEYNINFVIEADRDVKKDHVGSVNAKKYVLRVNTGSQIKSTNQIAYEFRALTLLSRSGVTPTPYYLDDSKALIPYGLLVMAYLPGEPLDYRSDLEMAAATFARIHGLQPENAETDFLIRDSGPFSAIFNESKDLLAKYFNCPDADPSVRRMLEKVFRIAQDRKEKEIYLQREPWLAVINTEVNSHNFIVNRGCQSCHLIDWEKPIWGEPAQDLSMFVIATTTLWKSNCLLDQEEESVFLKAYQNALAADNHKAPLFSAYKYTLPDRVAMFKFFNYLRAISWCAMAWTEYITPGRPLVNMDTFAKITMYLQPEFLKKCFHDI